MVRNTVFLILLTILSLFRGNAQELNCKVNVMPDQIPSVDPKIFATMQKDLQDFINQRKWGNDNFDAKEKIECVFSIMLSRKLEGVDGGYSARISVQSKRPVYNSSYTSTMVNYMDKDYSFKYIQFQPITFSDNRVAGSDPLEANLTAVVAYYCYLILGIDYDSFQLKGGTDFYNKALNIVNNAPEHKNIDGWKATDRDQKNRYWLVDQIMNSRYAAMREILYKYHRLGLDLMQTDEENARININVVFPMMQIINQDNPSSVWMKFFITAKTEEIQGYVAGLNPADQKQVIPILTQIDVTNAAKYLGLMK